ARGRRGAALRWPQGHRNPTVCRVGCHPGGPSVLSFMHTQFRAAIVAGGEVTLVIKYIGSKRKLVPHIIEQIQALDGVSRVCDIFTGTTRVAQGCKRAGMYVSANDLASYSLVFGGA